MKTLFAIMFLTLAFPLTYVYYDGNRFLLDLAGGNVDIFLLAFALTVGTSIVVFTGSLTIFLQRLWG